MIGPVIEYLCTNDSNVSGMVGTRVYPKYARQEIKQWPRVVYEVSQGDDDGYDNHTYDGVVGLVKDTVVISCCARTRKDANRLGVMVRGLLEGYTGTVNGIEVQGTFVDQPARDKEYVESENDQDSVIYAREVEVQFVFLEPAPTEV